jgi:hypothetical protein
MPSEDADIAEGRPIDLIFDNPRFSNDSGHKKRIDHSGVSYTRVFANAEAASYINIENVQFPVGATIVREKLPSENSTTPEVLTVMVKRARGFSPKTNDWEFLVINRDLNKIKMRQKTGNCADCHRSASQTDFVYKTKYQTAGETTPNSYP